MKPVENPLAIVLIAAMLNIHEIKKPNTRLAMAKANASGGFFVRPASREIITFLLHCSSYAVAAQRPRQRLCWELNIA